MRSATFSLVGLLFAFTPALRADDAADAKAIVERAIKARGDKIDAKFSAMTWKEKGKYFFEGMDLPFTAEWAVQTPDKLRVQFEFDVPNTPIQLTVTLSGEKGWYVVQGNVREFDNDQLGLMLLEMTKMWATSLVPLLTDDTFKLATAKGKDVDKKPTVAVKVTSGKRFAMTLYFDKETGLLVKREGMTLDDLTKDKEVFEEVFFSDYKEANGRKYATRAKVLHDGKVRFEATLSDEKVRDKLDPKLFEQPREKP